MNNTSRGKKIGVVVDSFYPAKTSAAIQMLDLCKALNFTGAKVTIFIPSSSVKEKIQLSSVDGIDVVSIKTPQLKNISHILRLYRETFLSFIMIKAYRSSSIRDSRFDAIVWYSPSIFISFFAKYLSMQSKCKSYLILRDIFPKWSVDIGLISKWSPVHLFLKIIENAQYKIADKVGIQSYGDLDYFNGYKKNIFNKVEVLNNWRSPPVEKKCDIVLENTILKDRKIFIYSGNIGLAQDFALFLKAVKSINNNNDIGFVVIGNGSELNFVKNYISKNDLSNIILLPEISHEQLPGLYKQCHFGLVLLDTNLKTHNIPGKFLSYLYAGLPVLASLNKGNDLEKIIDEFQIGCYSSDKDFNTLAMRMLELANMKFSKDENIIRCNQLIKKNYLPETAASQLTDFLFK